MRCSKCCFESAEGMAFCGKCGTELKATDDIPKEVKCQKCGSLMPSSAKFCGICGCELTHSGPAPKPMEHGQSVSFDDGAAARHVGQTQSFPGSTSVPDKCGSVDEAFEESLSCALREMVMIPEGWFAMGSSPEMGNDDEHPKHQVELSSYYIDRCKVSNLEYECFDPKHRRLRPEVADGDQDPVVFVSYEECLKYCRWRTEQEGLPPQIYLLPTEAQWERAARGRSSESLYPWGDEINLDECNTLECGRDRVMPIDEGTPNDFGLIFMGSNVREWCLDYYLKDYYKSMAAAGPNPTGPQRAMLVNMNVVRGASFQDKATELGRCAARNYAHPDSSSSDIGFRCVRLKH